MTENKEHPLIEYPTDWRFKIIGENLESMLSTIDDTIEGLESDLTPSNISKKGNYYSLNLVVKVKSEEERDNIYQELVSNPNIKMVL